MHVNRAEITRHECRLSEPRRKALAELGDLRFRSLLSPQQWAILPAGIRRRFSKRLSNGKTVVYVGRVVETHMSRVGWCLAQAARFIGAPLPTARDANVPSVVTVTEDVATTGQIWTRLYARRLGFPQVINSSKRFSGPTGLEEYIGHCIGMALTVEAQPNALVFKSAGYFLMLGRHRITLPRLLTPGACRITHTECGARQFEFKLEITHPVFGTLIRQVALFQESPEDAATDHSQSLDEPLSPPRSTSCRRL